MKFDPPVIGHRGACAYAPENTMASFIKAAQLGLKWVEFDVMLTADNELVIFHDEFLDRTSNGNGKIADHISSYLFSLDAGQWFSPKYSGERIPRLQTVIEFLENMNMNANVELKVFPGQEETLAKYVLSEMQTYLTKKNDSFLFSSFSTDTLRELRKYSESCHIGILLDERKQGWQRESKKLDAIAVHVNCDILTKELVSEIKSMDKILLCYTVNHPQQAKQLFTMGVDAVFSDAPDKIMKII